MQDPLRILIDVEQPEERRIEAVKAIAKARDLRHMDRMFAVSERAEAFLMRAIFAALREMNAHEALAKRLADPDPKARADAARKLSKLQDPRAAEALIEAARDTEPVVRRAAVHALSYLQAPAVTEALFAALRDPDPETRAYAAAGVGRSGDPRAAATLARARETEEDPVVQDFIEAALRKIPKQPAGAK
jgi:HEAT repeat protein